MSTDFRQAPRTSERPAGRRRLRRGAAVGLVVASLVAGWWWWDRRSPLAATEIYRGVTYGCVRLDAGPEGRGLVHWARVDLTSPGVGLYVTPTDPEACDAGWQYRLRRTGAVVGEERLAVAINATLFASDSGWLRLPGDLARSQETVVAEHEVSHVWEHTYLLWFEDDLTPHLEHAKPPRAEALARARWGVGGQGVGLRDGKVRAGASQGPAARTAVGIDAANKLLYLAVFERASPRRALEFLAGLGAREGMLLDGGGSTSMALGRDARGARPGVLFGGWRPVAVHLGVRAEPLP